MYKYSLLNNVSEKGLQLFGENFSLTKDLGDANIAIVRSATMHDMKTDHLLAIARAGSGTNNIPLQRCAKEGVVVFNTPGANSNAVKELSLLGMLMSARDALSGNAWVKTLEDDGGDIPAKIEKGKSRFIGSELFGKSVAVIGMGAIGSELSNSLSDLGMEVCGYSPSFSRGTRPKGLAHSIASKPSAKDAVCDADYVVLCLPLKDDTRGMFNHTIFSTMKDGVVLMNFSRSELIDEDDLEEALNCGKLRKYVTDFTTERVLKMQNTLCFPHMGASTKEATDNCAIMAVSQIKDYVLNGNIKNSVNYPEIDMGEKNGSKNLRAI